ncbi:MAG: glycosyltransferase family 4 protein [Gemmatimonadota bacterium]
MVAPEPFYVDRGTPICVRQVVEALVELGYEVDLLTYPLGEEVHLPGVRVHRSSNPLRLSQVPIGFSIRKLLLDCTLVFRLRSLMRDGRYRVVHALEESAFAAAYWGPRYGVRVIYDMHSSLAEQMGALPPFQNRMSRAIFRRAERWLLERVTQVVSSSGLAARVRSMAPRARALEWRFSSEPILPGTEEVAALRASLALSPGQRIVLYSGTFERYQGLNLLLKAIARVQETNPEAVFVLIGVDGERASARIQRLAEGIPGDRLRLIKRQPRRSMPAWLALADLLVSPRLFGGNLPLKIFDYMAAGRPIIATDIPSHRSVLTEERALLVSPRVEALAEAISDLLGDPERAGRLATLAQSYAREHLGWSRFVTSVQQLYSTADPQERDPVRNA